MRTTTLLIAFVLATWAFAQEAWIQKAAFPGYSRWGVACFEANGIGYMVGGRTASGVDLNELWAYDPATDTWQQKAPMPGTRRLPTAFSLNGKGYITCGLTSSGTLLSDTWEYTPSSDSWASRASFPGVARYGAASFTINNQGYLACGALGSATGPYASDLWRYDPMLNQWTALASMPDQGRVGAVGFSAAGKGYVATGRQLDQTFTNELWEYDLNANYWTIKTAMPAIARTHSYTYSMGDKAVVVAGHGTTAVLADSWYYTSVTDSWTALPSYIGGGTWAGANMLIGNRIFAGLGQTNGTTYGDLYELKGLTIGINDHTATSQTVLYPNPCPTGGQLVVELAHPGQRAQLEILDALGQHIANYTLLGNRQVVTLPALSAGVYVCLVREANGQAESIRLNVIQ